MSRLPVSIADSARSHMSRTRLLTGSAPFLVVKSLARLRYSYWMSRALSSRPLASRTRLRPVMSWLTSRMARIALSRVRSRMIAPASIIRSTRSAVPADQVVLVAAVGVARGVGVVLEQVDVAGDALLAQPPVGVDEQPLQDPLPRLVVGDEVQHVVALGRGVLRVAAHVEIEPRSVP